MREEKKMGWLRVMDTIQPFMVDQTHPHQLVKQQYVLFADILYLSQIRNNTSTEDQTPKIDHSKLIICISISYFFIASSTAQVRSC